MVEGLSCLLYVHMQQATAAPAENWVYFVEKARTGDSWLWNQNKNSQCAKNRELIDSLIEK